MCLLRKHLNFQGFLGSLQILLADCQSIVASVYLPSDSLQVVLVCQLIAAEGIEYPHRGFRCSQRTLQEFGTAHNIEAAIISILPVVGSPGNLYQSPALILHAIALLGVAEVFPALVGSAACQFFGVSELTGFVRYLRKIMSHAKFRIDVEMLCPSVYDWKVGVCPAACIRHYL